MIIITGAAGMIGSVVAWHFNEILNENSLILCDDMASGNQEKNFSKRQIVDFIKKDDLDKMLAQSDTSKIEAIIHMGAISATTESNFSRLIADNIRFSQNLWAFCSNNKIPYIFASSAATYGSGDNGYSDESVANLNPLNAYGYSKHFFDQWALAKDRNSSPPFWAGCKFFNVYGPNEYHKGRMSSVVFHAFNQIQKDGNIKLFKSNHPKFKDGEQLRDFIYVKDAVNAIIHLLTAKPTPGIYNIGTGKAQTFYQLAKALVINHKKTEDNIKFIEMPNDLNGKYQYFTEAKIEKLIHSGYTKSFMNLEEGVTDYYQNYLSKEDQYL